jgi:hypothetical protein
MENLLIVLNRWGEWAVENAMVINSAKSKTVCFMRARVAEPLNYFVTRHSNSGSDQL